MLKTIQQKFAEAIGEIESYAGHPDADNPLFVDKDNCQFELVFKDEDTGEWKRLTYGDLKELIGAANA